MRHIFDAKRKDNHKSKSEEAPAEIDLSELSRFTTYHHQKPLSQEEYERVMDLIDDLEEI